MNAYLKLLWKTSSTCWVLRSSNFDFFDVIELVISYTLKETKKKIRLSMGRGQNTIMLTSWILSATFSRRYLNLKMLTSSSPITIWEKEMQVLLFIFWNTFYYFKHESVIWSVFAGKPTLQCKKDCLKWSIKNTEISRFTDLSATIKCRNL